MPKSGHKTGARKCDIKGDAKYEVREDKNKKGKSDGISSDRHVLIPPDTASFIWQDKNGRTKSRDIRNRENTE